MCLAFVSVSPVLLPVGGFSDRDRRVCMHFLEDQPIRALRFRMYGPLS